MTHTAHHAAMASDFKKRFIISVIATIPILLLSPMIQGFFSFAIVFPGSMIALFALATCVYGYGGWPFIKGCVLELRERKVGMMTLVAMAITATHSYSVLVALKVIPGKMFFWEVATLIDVMLVGHWIEMKTVLVASTSLEKLAHLIPATATLVMPDSSLQEVEQKDLEAGNKILVKPGDKVPADGTIVEGHSSVNQAALTGESIPVFKTKGDKIIGGSINQNGSLVVRVEKTGAKSYLAKIIGMVEAASTSKSRAQTLADKAAFALTIIALLAGTATLLIWLNWQTVHFALERMITVMVITCPHALGLAIPLVVASITMVATHKGLLIKNRTAFETARKSTVVVFDKTGTLTSGNFGVTTIKPLSDWNETKLLQRAATLENRSEHMIAKAVVRKAQEENLSLPNVANFKAIPGLGVTAFVEGDELFVGSPELFSGTRDSASAKLFPTNFPVQELSDARKEIEALEARGKTVIVVATKTAIKGVLAMSDVVRKKSIIACSELRKLKMELAMITGDNQQVADNVAEQLGITHVFANVLPDEKAEKIQGLQGEGHTVIMVGDGVNDAPALAQADVGIAIGSGTDIAAETADVILVHNDPVDVVNAIKLSQLMYKKMVQNLGWTTGYNVLAIPLAAGVLYHQGILLPPAVGALVMTASTLIVAFNSRIKAAE